MPKTFGQQKPIIHILDADLRCQHLTGLVTGRLDATVQKYTAGHKLLKQIDGRRDGCILIDLTMPSVLDLKLMEKLKGWSPLFPVIMFTNQANTPITHQVTDTQAFDWLQKPTMEQDLIQQIADALSWSKNIRLKHMESVAVWSSVQKLTSRELEVLDLILTGQSSREIGTKLSISRFTADHHRANILTKLELPTIISLIGQVTRAKIVIENFGDAANSSHRRDVGR